MNKDEKMTAFDYAKLYYPQLWDRSRIDALYKAGKLTDDEYARIVGEEQA